MSNDMIIVFFGELSTKGKNIMDFIRLLGKNIKDSLKNDFPALRYEIKKDHIYIILNDEKYEDIVPYLKKIPGIGSFSLAISCQTDLDCISKTALDLYNKSNAITFKIDCKRADKNYKIKSMDVASKVGAYILKNNSKSKVDVHSPQILINVMIREDFAYVYGIKEKGLGGYPLGIAGKTLTLLSGGIDSPVSAYLMMKRGVKVEAIHFAAPPYTSDAVIDKIEDLLHKLNDYQSEIKLYIVPFTDLEKTIYDIAGPSYCVTIMRRMMLRIASIVALRHNDLVLSGGESIGQVASQTLYSMKVIDCVSNLPFIRPLACYDKTEIIDLAKKIDTYDISIRPFEDCCTIFTLKDPVTHPNIEKVEEIESKFDYKSMILDCVKNIEVRKICKTNEEEI